MLLARLRLVGALAGVVSLPACGGAQTTPNLQSVLGRYGYVALRPPSTLVPPGTIIQVRSREPLEALIVCTRAASLGPDVPIQQSPSADSALVSDVSQAFSLSASLPTLLSGKAAYSSIRDVTMSVTNVNVLEISDADVFEGITHRRPACTEAIESLAQQPNATISMVKSVISADVTYSVHYKDDASLDAGARQQLLTTLAGDLHADVGTSTADTLQGHALFWGVIDDVRLAQVGLSLPGGTRAAAGSRVLPASGDLHVSDQPLVQ